MPDNLECDIHLTMCPLGSLEANFAPDGAGDRVCVFAGQRGSNRFVIVGRLKPRGKRCGPGSDRDIIAGERRQLSELRRVVALIHETYSQWKPAK